MFPTALLAAVFALQGAGQKPPPTGTTQGTQTGAAQTQTSPPVPAGIPDKYLAPAPGPGSAIARVDGQSIFGHDVESLLWEAFGPQSVEDVINLVMIRRAATKENVHVTTAEIEKRLKDNIKLFDEQSKTDQQRVQQNLTVEQLLVQKGFPMSRLYVDTEIEVTLDKIAEKGFKPDAYVKVSVLLYKPTGPTAADIATAQQNANAAVARLKAGTSKWEAEVAKCSLPPEFISKGGLLGWLEQSTFPADVAPKVMALQPGQFTDAIKYEGQGITTYQVFRMEQLGSKAVGADLDGLKARYLQSRHQPLLTSIRAAAKIERFPTTAPIAGKS
ncbi:MAG TPA: peptidylprolyl isomerase [Fimbriimonadaceae bacterium]|nr:peptidylprolyl isomerase [Fimbriimonadaceae bacterium]